MENMDSTRDWFSTKEVTRFVAEEIWKKFLYAKEDGNRIVWEFGFIENIVDAALHREDAPKSSQEFYNKRDKIETEATRHIAFEAIKKVNQLAGKLDVKLLLLLGLGQMPRNPQLTLDGMLEAEAAAIYEEKQPQFHRRFEGAKRFLKKYQKELKILDNARLKEIGSLGRFSASNVKFASKFPKFSRLIDNELRRRNQEGTSACVSLRDLPQTDFVKRMRSIVESAKGQGKFRRA